jgi:hypothetical protein
MTLVQDLLLLFICSVKGHSLAVLSGKLDTRYCSGNLARMNAFQTRLNVFAFCVTTVKTHHKLIATDLRQLVQCQ